MLVCKDCGNEQDEIKLGMRVSYKISNNIRLYKTPKMKEWEKVPKNICNKCKSENLEKPEDYYKSVIVYESSRVDPKSPFYWKKGKTNEYISRVLTGERDPY